MRGTGGGRNVLEGGPLDCCGGLRGRAGQLGAIQAPLVLSPS